MRFAFGIFLFASMAWIAPLQFSRAEGTASTSESNAAVPRNAEVERLADKYAKKFKTVPQVSVDEARVLIEQGNVLLLDARSRVEQSVSRIPGAVSASQFLAKPNEGRIVIAYCTVGYRSSQTAKKLRKQGVDAYNLRGGILAWCNGLLPLETPHGDATNRVHTYGASWNIVPRSYVAVQ